MRTLVAALLLFAGNAAAHRLDEYLQATTISVEQDRITMSMRLNPGVAVAPFVLATIDRDADGIISNNEESAYAEQVLRDLSLTLDGNVLPLHLTSGKFPQVQDLREGLGEIQFEFSANIPYPHSGNRTLQFENSHQPRIGAYLVNALVPSDPQIRIASQTRNFQQSSYRLDYSQTGSFTNSLPFIPWSQPRTWLIALALLMTTRFAFLLHRA
jgi:hypothetical protein